MADLTVVVPAYNAASLLPRLFSSLEDQPQWAVIVVDDGSTDNTADVAERWLRSRSSGQLITTQNAGAGSARQTGLDACRTKFVTFADADDEIVTMTLAKLLDVQIALKADVAIGSYRELPGEPRQVLLRPIPIRSAASRLALTSRAAVWGKIFRSDFLHSKGITFPDLRVADDVVFSWRVASAQPTVIRTDSVVYQYHVDPHGQLTSHEHYLNGAVDALATLFQESRGSAFRARALAWFAIVTGIAYLLRRNSPRVWRQALGVIAPPIIARPGN